MVGAPWRVRDGRHVWFWDGHFTVMLSGELLRYLGRKGKGRHPCSALEKTLHSLVIRSTYFLARKAMIECSTLEGHVYITSSRLFIIPLQQAGRSLLSVQFSLSTYSLRKTLFPLTNMSYNLL
jgi:hypothetical protein